VIKTYENLFVESLQIIAEKDFRITRLEQELSELKRLIYGSKSERFIPTVHPSQSSLFELPMVTKPEVKEQITYERKKVEKLTKDAAGRQMLPSHLERVEIIVEPLEKTEGLIKIGEEVTEELEYFPPVLKVNKYIRPKYAKQGAEGVLIGRLPSRPIEKGIPGPALLAHILISKYVDHLPLYRQIGQFKRLGVDVPASTMSDWVGAASDLIAPLYDVLKKEVLQSGYIQADETPIKVLDEDKKGSTHKGFYWVYHSPEKRLVLFDYRPGRGREGPQEILNNYQGYLQTDAYSAYDSFNTPKIKLLHCMAHARRMFEKALDNDKERADFAMRKIQSLYAIERSLRENKTGAAEKLKLRMQDAMPILKELELWMKEEIMKVTPQSLIGKAIAYSLSRWDKLSIYATDGRLEIDNNLVENAIRPVAIGRKNYLFAGSHEAAQRAAVIYSLVETARKNNIEPFEWMKNTLTVIADHKANKLNLLLPV
jgi:transposase